MALDSGRRANHLGSGLHGVMYQCFCPNEDAEGGRSQMQKGPSYLDRLGPPLLGSFAEEWILVNNKLKRSWHWVHAAEESWSVDWISSTLRKRLRVCAC